MFSDVVLVDVHSELSPSSADIDSSLKRLYQKTCSALGRGFVTKGFLKQPVSFCSCLVDLEAELVAGSLYCEIRHC